MAHLLSSCDQDPRCPPRPRPSVPTAAMAHARLLDGGSRACPSGSVSPSGSGRGQMLSAVASVLVRPPSWWCFLYVLLKLRREGACRWVVVCWLLSSEEAGAVVTPTSHRRVWKILEPKVWCTCPMCGHSVWLGVLSRGDLSDGKRIEDIQGSSGCLLISRMGAGRNGMLFVIFLEGGTVFQTDCL